MAELGQMLRNARESQGLSLSDVSERIHIRSAYLAAIETEDWAIIGPAVYVRGFVRSYARCLGLDPDAAVAKLGSAVSSAPTAMIPPGKSEQSRDAGRRATSTRVDRAERPASRPSTAAIVGVIIALALVAFVGYQYVSQSLGGAGAARKVAVAASPSPEAGAVTTPAEATPTQAATPEPRPSVANVVKSHALDVRIRDRSWVRVTLDGKVLMEGVFPAGTARSFAGHAATVRVGNAAGVEIAVDGKTQAPLGGEGDVAQRSFRL